jgi:thymidylate synthase
MNNIDSQYTDLLQDILDNGVTKSDRTGTGTISVFGRQIRHKMSEGFPLLTSKKMAWKTIVTELLWFLRGDTNIRYLVENNCNIWNGDAYKNYERQVPSEKVIGSDLDTLKNSMMWKRKTDSTSGYPIYERLSQEEFINKIKTDSEFAEKWGSLGPVYGSQWRRWKYPIGVGFTGSISIDGTSTNNAPSIAYDQIDQIANLIRDMKNNPDSRRLMVSAWNVGELDNMVLPPCHYGFQVYTRELSAQERLEWVKVNLPNIDVNGFVNNDEYSHKWVETLSNNIPKRAISLMWNQRSVDTFLGLPFNIASYGLLLEIIAKEVNMVPDELIGNLGDTHLYLNHIEQAKEQIGRDYTLEERLNMVSEEIQNEFSSGIVNLPNFPNTPVRSDDGKMSCLDNFGVPRRTREPYPLPTLSYLDEYHYLTDKKLVGDIPFSKKIEEFRPDFFKVVDYQSHPSIKAPLSN